MGSNRRDSAPAFLEVRQVEKRFGGVLAVNGLSFQVLKGEIVGLIGPNGAGKTTVFNIISGVTRPDRGLVVLDGREVQGLHPFQIARLGIARTFQEIHLFKELTVLHNVMSAGHLRATYGFWEGLLRLPRVRRIESRLAEESLNMLSMFGLGDVATAGAGELPYGLQKTLEIVKALITRPRLLLLDEPAAGLNPEETDRLKELIHRIRDQFDLTIIVIEHTMDLIRDVSDHIVVMNFGEKLAEGHWDEVRCNEDVVRCYLGED
ncbi:MAG TPA: ABC transporter ATP-binding protein [Firmicutes bacterium]|nr:ABC transporter ATP-binding protein [Bacillota bacterium]